MQLLQVGHDTIHSKRANSGRLLKTLFGYVKIMERWLTPIPPNIQITFSETGRKYMRNTFAKQLVSRRPLL